MITNHRVLDADWVPKELRAREGQLNVIEACLSPLTAGESGENVLIFGPSGTGKTTIARYMAAELERATHRVAVGEVNCMGESTEAQALHALLDDALARAAIPPPRGTPAGHYLELLRDLDEHLLAIVDEAGALRDPDLLATLHDTPGVTTVAISVSETDLLSGASGPLRSRLHGARRLDLEPYTDAELVAILEDRAEHALTIGAAPARTLAHIADIAHGDAREAIALLRQAARAVERRDDGPIEPADVDSVREAAEDDVRTQQVAALGTHRRLLYEIIVDAGEQGITGEDLAARYEHDADEPRSESSRARYLQSLQRYGLIERSGSTKGVRYSV